MYPDGRIIHLGINYITAPMSAIDMRKRIDFQHALVDEGITDFDRVEPHEGKVIVIRNAPNPLQITVATLDAPPPLGQAGQLLVVSPWTGYEFDSFGKNVEAVVKAFKNSWKADNRQILSCDATIRYLFQSTEDHAFQELWEVTLGQSHERLNSLKRPVLGGGIRFVMPPYEGSEVKAEVKIESWFQDTSQVFVEVQHAWQTQTTEFGPLDKLHQVYNYIEENVIPFIMGDVK